MVIVISSIVNFLLVVFILWYFGRKPTAEFFAHRRTAIESAIGEAETLYFEAEKTLNTWETKWKQCEAQAKALFDEAKGTLARHREKTLGAANEEAARLAKESQLLGKGEVLRARRLLQQELAERSISMAEKFMEKQLDDRDRHKLVSEYVEIVGNGKA
jgi:F-type H+-transporting ATPase subunit b